VPLEEERKMNLTFTHWRQMLPTYLLGERSAAKAAAAKSATDGRRLLEPNALSSADSDQFVACLKHGFGIGDAVSDAADLYDEARRGDPQLGETIEQITSAIVEWWDVVDEGGSIHYHVWLYGYEFGKILEAGTNRVLGTFIEQSLEMDPDSVPEALFEAAAEAQAVYPASELAKMSLDIDDDDWY